MRTIHDRRYFSVDPLNMVTNNPNLVIDTVNLVTDNGNSIVNAESDIRNSPHSTNVIDSMRGLQYLRSSHLSFFLR